MSPFANYFPKTDPLMRRLADPAYRALQDEAFRALARGYEATFAKRGIEWPGLLRLIDLAVPEKAGADLGPHGLLGEDGDLIMARHRPIDPLITIGSRERFFDRLFPMPGASGDRAARMAAGSGAAAGGVEALGPYSPALPAPSAGDHSIG
ncbi:MAG: hypothetical protein ACREGL_03270 [Alphaproteobacteria bacterium]